MARVVRDPDLPAPRGRRPAPRFGYRRANMQTVFVHYDPDDGQDYVAAPPQRPAQNPRRGNGVSRRGRGARGGARGAAVPAASRQPRNAGNSTDPSQQHPPNANLERPPRNGTLTSLNDRTDPALRTSSTRQTPHSTTFQEASSNSQLPPVTSNQNTSIRLDARAWSLLEEWLDARGTINGGNRLQGELAQARRNLCLPFLNERPDLFNAFIVWIQLEDCEGGNMSPVLAASQFQVYIDECERSISQQMNNVTRDNVNGLAASIFVLMTCAFRTGDQASARNNFDRLCRLIARFPSVAADIHLFKSLLLSWGYIFTAWDSEAMLSLLPDYLTFGDDFAVTEMADVARADRNAPREFRFIDLQRTGVISLESLEVALAIRKTWHFTHRARAVSSISDQNAAEFLRSLIWTGVRLTKINFESTNRPTLEQAINFAQGIIWTHSQISSRRPAFEVLAAAIVHQIVNIEDIDAVLADHAETVLWLLMLATPFQKQGQGIAIPEILSKIKTRLNIIDFAQVRDICGEYFWDTDLDELAEISWHEAMQVAQPRTPNSFTDIRNHIAALQRSAENRANNRRPLEDRTFEFMKLARFLYSRNDEGMRRIPQPDPNDQSGVRHAPMPVNPTIAQLINLSAAFRPPSRN